MPPKTLSRIHELGFPSPRPPAIPWFPVHFICLAPQAQKVAVVGEFNAWNPDSNPMAQAFDGSWQASVSIRHGHHQYAFWVDGTLQVDPRGQGISRNAEGQRVSLLAVS